jgi:ATP-binding cassette subfamily E protein 1
MESLLDREVLTLSGGELQRLAITLCLGKPAEIYLIDEPSAYLDAEQRVNVSRVIKRFVRNAKKAAFVVEHDFIMATYLADRVIVFEGRASVNATATQPQSLVTGINSFLKCLNITFRRDRHNYRPRINKLNGFKVRTHFFFCFNFNNHLFFTKANSYIYNIISKDTEQKQSGNYFLLDL